MSNPQIRGELKWRREKWRREWIAKFTERQRIARRWIAFIDLVDWCGESTTAAGLKEEAGARKVAYQRLADSAQEGEFERDGRSKILYLDALVTGDGASPRCRLTREQFKIALDVAAMPPAPSLPLEVLNCCWLPRALVRHWLQSHGYRPAPHLEPAAKKPTARTIHDFDVQVGWVPLTAALEIIRAAAGEPAWEQVKKAIRLKALPARCQADGFTRDLEPHWLDFLAWDDCDGDVLWFDREKAWRAFARPVGRTAIPVPDRAENIVVPIARCAELWPGGAWPERGLVKRIPEGDPLTPITPADPLSGGADVFDRQVDELRHRRRAYDFRMVHDIH
jgi:hypothetical protein